MGKVVPFPIGGTFERGDQVELAMRLIAHDEVVTGVRPVSDSEGTYHLWDDETLLWRAVDQDTLKCRVDDLAGAPVEGAKGPRPLKVKAGDGPAVAEVMRRQTLEHDFFRDDVIAFKNGFVVHVERDDLLVSRATPELGARTLFPIDYDADWTMPEESNLAHYLRTSWDDEVDRIRAVEVLGAALMGLGPRYRKAWLLCDDPDIIGSRGGTGKSVYLDSLERLVPAERRCSVSPQMLSSRGEQSLYHAARLYGRTLNTVREIDDSEIIRDDAWKAIVFGEQVPARHPAGRTFDLNPMALHVVAANTPPRVAGASGAYWDRWAVMMWSKRMRGTDDEIPDLAERITQDEYSDLVHLAIRGAIRLIERGAYTKSASSAAMLEQWRVSADPVARFIEEWCVAIDDTNARNWPTGLELFDAYCEWCKARRHSESSERTFSMRLRALVERKRSNGSRYRVRVLSTSERQLREGAQDWEGI